MDVCWTPAPGDPGTDSATGVPSYAGMEICKRNDPEVHGRHGWHEWHESWKIWKKIGERSIKKHVQQTLQDVLFRRLALCITCPHFQVPWDWEGSNHALQDAQFVAVEENFVAGGWEDTLLLEHGNLADMGWGLTGTHGIYCKERHCGPSKLADSGVATRFCIVVTTPRPLRPWKNPRCLGLHRETDQCEPPGGLC